LRRRQAIDILFYFSIAISITAMTLSFIQDLLQLQQAKAQLVAIQSPATERQILLKALLQFSDNSLHFWSIGCPQIQAVGKADDCIRFDSRDRDPVTDILAFILRNHTSGCFVLAGLLELDEGELSATRIAELADMFYGLRSRPDLQIILINDTAKLPIPLIPMVPVLVHPLPDSDAIADVIQTVCPKLEDQQRLIQVCLGLHLGELQMVLVRYSAICQDEEELVRSLLTYKTSKLKQRGLEFTSAPDVQPMGLDLLEAILDRDCALLSPDVRQYGLSLPKGILLWGPPGTGKSLSAKYAASKMSVPLLAASWGSLRSPKPGQSERNLDFLLEQCCINAPVVLFFDDFDKGFAGWNADTDGGIEGRLANKLLTWMQERIEPVYVVATCNRLEKLPPELIRRFDTIVFVDLPHAGARKAIFEVHLAKYFPTLPPFTESEWRKLLKATHLCTPAEIALMVRKTAQEVFYQGKPGMCTISDLLEQRSLIVPAMIREEEAILAIRNRASFARPAASCDRSEWATPDQRLFQNVTMSPNEAHFDDNLDRD
jgi:hypothetical protein